MPLCPYEAVHQYAILDIPHAVGQLEDSLRPVLHAAVFSLSASFEIRGFSAIRQRSCSTTYYNILHTASLTASIVLVTSGCVLYNVKLTLRYRILGIS